MGKLWDLLSLFRKGNEIADSEKWKDGGNAATLLVPIMMLIVKVLGDFGVTDVKLSNEEATSIAFGIVSIVQFVIANITSKRSGLLPAKPAEQVSTSNSTKPQELPTEVYLPPETKASLEASVDRDKRIFGDY